MRALKLLSAGMLSLAVLWSCDDKDDSTNVNEKQIVEDGTHHRSTAYKVEVDGAVISAYDTRFYLSSGDIVIVFDCNGGIVDLTVDSDVEWVAENTNPDSFVVDKSETDATALTVSAYKITAGKTASTKIKLTSASTKAEIATIYVFQNQYNIVTSVTEDDQIKVLSFNVLTSTSESDTSHSWENRRDACCAIIVDENPTVFGVQEAQNGQMTYIRDNTGYSYIGVGRDNGSTSGEYMGVFYKTDELTLGDWGTFWYSDTPDEPSIGFNANYRNTVTWAFFTHIKTGEEFFFMNTHMDYSASPRQQQANLLVDKYYEINPSRIKTIITGDFNIESSDYTLSRINALFESARDTAPITDDHVTFNNFGEATTTGAIDHVFYQGFTALEFKTVLTVYFDVEYASDHWPVAALLQF